MFPVITLLTSLVLAFGSPARADDCVAAAPTAVLKAEAQKNVKNYKMTFKKSTPKSWGHVMKETFKLKSGIAVVIEQGGCAHFGTSITYVTNGQLKKPNDLAKWTTEAKRMLDELAVLGLKNPSKSTIEALEAKTDKLSLSDESDSLSMEVTDENGYETDGLVVMPKGKGKVEIKINESYSL
ncbi:MAG: hypothetical protein V4760_09925 [Bdellovibrionota bacterium]